MDPLSFAAAVGRQVVRELNTSSSSSGKRVHTDNLRRKNISENKKVDLDQYEINLLEKEISKIHSENKNYKKIELGWIDKTEENINKVKNEEDGPVYGLFSDKIVHMQGPHDKKTGFRSYKFKCTACGENSVHTNSITNAKIYTSCFKNTKGSGVYIDNLLGDYLGDLNKVLNAISMIEFTGHPGGQHLDRGYVCSNCGDKNWFQLEVACDCKGSIGVEKGYTNVVPVAAKSSAPTTKYCMMCGADCGLLGNIF